MDTEIVVHIYNGILLSYKKKTFEFILMRWMNLEPIIQSEVSQKEKNNYLLLTHIYCRQEYWSGFPFPSPGDLPYPGIEPGSPTLQADSLLSEPPEKP